MIATTLMLAGDDLLHYLVIRILEAIGQFLAGLRHRIVPGFDILPAISLRQCFFLGKRKIFLSQCFVVSKRRKGCREKFSIPVFSSHLIYIWHIVHVLPYLGNKVFVFVLRILLVQDAIFLVPNADTSE